MLGGQTLVLDFFACFFGDDAVEAFGTAADASSATFAAIGQASAGGGTASVVINGNDRGGGITTYNVAYVHSGDSNTAWHGDSETTGFAIERNHVTYEGDFVELVDDVVTGNNELGSLDATCGS